MTGVNLRPFLRPKLDILFVGLNPPAESNSNGHYFSGRKSRFFDLLSMSGLIRTEISKSTADEVVFGSTSINYDGREFGVVDLVEDIVQTNSGKVQPTTQHVEILFDRLHQFQPRFVCIVHHKVRHALDRHPAFLKPLQYGICGQLLRGSTSVFVLNYFPNGNNVSDIQKLNIFRALRDEL